MWHEVSIPKGLYNKAAGCPNQPFFDLHAAGGPKKKANILAPLSSIMRFPILLNGRGDAKVLIKRAWLVVYPAGSRPFLPCPRK